MMRMISFLLFYSFLFGTNIPFKVGETLSYQASFSGLDAATGKLKVIEKEIVNDISTFHVRFTARTHGFADYLFPIHDVIDLWLDDKTLLPVKVIKNISEGNYKKTRETLLNQKAGYAIVNKDTILIEMGTHSPYSLFYYFRNEDLRIQDIKSFSTIDGKQVTSLEMQFNRGIQIKVPAGEFLCTEVTPVRFDQKKFKNDAKMAIWFTNDDARIPAQIWLKLKFGALVLKLKTVSN